MEDIIQKRTELANFFLNEDKIYTKKEILHREFAVLSFSPREDYIDTIVTEYDDLCVDLDKFDFDDTEECYIKGIIADVDRQKYKTIIHLQNKSYNIGIHIHNYLANIYSEYLNVGEPIIAKCKIWNEKFFMSLMLSLDYLDGDNFEQEQKYIKGVSLDNFKKLNLSPNSKYKYGLVKECTQFRTKKGKDMLRGTLYNDDGEEQSFGCMINAFGVKSKEELPRASDFIKYTQSGKFFINDVEVVSYANIEIKTQFISTMSS